jgi:hypothetical protein
MADVTLDLIYQKTMQIEQLVQSLPQNLSVINAEQVNAQFLSAISANLGTVTAGELRVGTPNVSPGNGFSGLRLKWPPMTYEGEQWNLVGVNNDVFQVGIRTSDGTLRAGGGHIIIDSVGLRSDNFVSGISGFTINQPSGDAEFNNVLIRGEMRSTVFTKGLIDVQAGTLIVAKSAGMLYYDMTVPLSGSWYMYIKDSPGGGYLFAVNDLCRIKSEYSGGVADTWVIITGRSQFTGFQRYLVEWQSGTQDYVAPAGAPVVDYGVSGQGMISLSADGSIGAGANMSLMTHAGSPWSTQTLMSRYGNMRDSYGTGANDHYGFGVGDYSGGNYLSYNAEAANKFVVQAGSGKVLIDEGGLRTISDGTSPVASKLRFMTSEGGSIRQVGDVSGGWAGGVGDGAITWVTSVLDTTDPWAYPQVILNAWNKKEGIDARLYLFGGTDPSAGIGSIREFKLDGIAKVASPRVQFVQLTLDSTLTTTAGFGPSILMSGKRGTSSPAQIAYMAAVWDNITNSHGKIEFGVVGSGSIATRMEMTKDDFYSVAWTSYGSSSTITGWSGTPTVGLRYKKIGRLVFVYFHISGTSDSTVASFTLPYAAADIHRAGLCRKRDNSVWAEGGHCQINASSNTVTCYPDSAQGNWTNVNTKLVNGQFWYEASS